MQSTSKQTLPPSPRRASTSKEAFVKAPVQAPPLPPEMPLEALQRMSSVDNVVAEIVRGLYDGRYVAGQKLTEAELSRRYGVGRGSVREALRRLSAGGLVTLSHHRGASIRSLTRDGARDILEIIEALSGLSARLAAERLARPEDEDSLARTMEELTSAAQSGDAFEFGRTRNRFYRLLGQLSGNNELSGMISTLQAHLVRVQFRAAYGLRAEKQRLGDYKRVVESILARDGDKAEKAMRQHIRGTARAISQLPESDFAM